MILALTGFKKHFFPQMECNAKGIKHGQRQIPTTLENRELFFKTNLQFCSGEKKSEQKR